MVARKSSRRKMARLSDQVLEQLLDMAIESVAEDQYRDFNGSPDEDSYRVLNKADDRYHDLLEKEVLKWLMKNEGDLDPKDRNMLRLEGNPKKMAEYLVDHSDLAFLYFMQTVGHGVGIYDGELDYLFASDRSESRDLLKDLEKFLDKGPVEKAVHELDSAIYEAAFSALEDHNERVREREEEEAFDDDEDDEDFDSDRYASRKASVSDKEIRDLMRKAENEGDLVQVEMCQRALKGDRAARRECEQAIYDITSENMRAWYRDRDKYASRNFRSRRAADQSLVDMIRRGEGRGADLEGSNLKGADLKGANLKEANLAGANLAGANLYGADLDGANLERAVLTGANLRGANLDGADLKRVDIERANLAGANLRFAKLTSAKLVRANLEGAKLIGANLSGASLKGAFLTDANLEKVDLSGANLEGADLDGANLKGVKYNSKTTWPRDFTPPGEGRMASRSRRLW